MHVPVVAGQYNRPPLPYGSAPGPGPAQACPRWVYGYMVAEYARHLGHADLLRECTDGAVGE